MGALIRLRAYAGLWTLLAGLCAALVFLSAAAGPVSRQVADRALRQLVAEAPQSVRDITVTEPAAVDPITAARMRDEVTAALPPSLAGVVGEAWGIQRTRVQAAPLCSTLRCEPHGVREAMLSASVTGEGIATFGPGGFMPMAALHHQTGLAEAVRVVAGEVPETGGGSDRGSGDPVIAVMASAGVAEGLGLRVGETYGLLPGVAARSPVPAGESGTSAVAFELTGVFVARDAAAAVWGPDPRLLRPGLVQWPLAEDRKSVV